MITETTRRRRTVWPRVWQRVRYLAGRALWMEIGVWQSLYRFVFRRPRVPVGAVGFGYHQPVRAILIVFLALSAVEIIVLDLIVHRWTFVRIPVLVVGIWGLTWMLGLLLGYLTRPHAVGPDGLRIRQGAEIDIPIAWGVVDFVALAKHTVDSTRAPRVTTDGDGSTLHLRMSYDTNVDLRLQHPITVRLPQGTETVIGIRFWVDDPKGYLAAVRRLIRP